MAVALRQASTDSLVFESNSSSVVAQIVNPSSIPWGFHFVFHEFCNVFDQDISWFISHIGKFANDVVDALARMSLEGINLIEFV